MRWLFFFLLLPSLAFASEECVSQLKGNCRNACLSSEKAEQGAFIDCGETQQCCVPREPARTPSVSTVILIEGYAFKPVTLKVKAGTEVVWKNKDNVEHTITASDSSFDSGSLGQGGEFRRIFAKPGTYSYYCDLHPSMTGTIEVVQ